jgi:hypothetical protein
VSSRTASLFMLSIMALGMTAVLVAAMQPAAVAIDPSTPWLVPLLGVICYSATFFLGRRHILPHGLASSATHAGLTIVALVLVSMALVYAMVWGLRSVVGGVPGPWTLVLWFAVLWLAVEVLHRRAAAILDRSGGP